MAALSTLFPVFFMLALGFVAHRRGWLTPEQKAGANAMIFQILFPLLIFNLTCTATIDASRLSVTGYVLVVYLLGMALGKLTSGFTGKRYAHFSPYLFGCQEGGSVALPLYLSIVGKSSNTVFFDLAGTAVCFFVIPVLVARAGSKGASPKDMLVSVLTNSFVVAVIAGLAMNLTGVYGALVASPLGDVYTNTFDMATKAISPMILFCLGYDFKIDGQTVAPLLKLTLVKTCWFALAIAGFFVLFPALMADKVFMMCAFIYLMSPTGMGLVPIITPTFRNQDDAALVSAFIPLYLVVTLVVYTCVVVFVA